MTHHPDSITKGEAIRRLRAAGLTLEAADLDAWRAENGHNWGWDGWIQRAHPQAVRVIWPSSPNGGGESRQSATTDEIGSGLGSAYATSIFSAHFDGQSIVLDEPATLAVGQPVQVIVRSTSNYQAHQPRPSKFGFARGMFEMSDDFNDPLDEFAEYR